MEVRTMAILGTTCRSCDPQRLPGSADAPVSTNTPGRRAPMH